MTDIADDVKYGLRSLWRTPAFTAAAMVTLALAIGACSSVFSVVNAALLRGLPYKDPARLVLLWGTESSSMADRSQVSATDARDWAQKSDSLEALAVYEGASATLTAAGDPQRLSALKHSIDYFSVMRAQPYLGRFFDAGDFHDGAQYVAVLAYHFWKQQFHGDPSIIGKSIPLDFRSYVVVGVAPSDLHALPATLTFRSTPTQVYLPLAGKYEDPTEPNRTARHLRIVGRLKPHITVGQAQAELNVIQAQMIKDHPAEDSGHGVRVVPIKEDLVRNIRTALLILQCSVIVVVMIACANIANLLLARSQAKKQELAIRSALGASRLRLAQQLITESLLLALAGGACGLLLAQWGVAVLVRLGTSVLPELNNVEMNAPVLLFTLIMSLLTGIVFGMAPALHFSSPALGEALRSGSRTAGPTQREGRTRATLVAAEIALSMVLLVCAGLLLKSFVLLQRVNPGFDSHNVLTASISLPAMRYPEIPQQQAFFRELLSKEVQIPGVESAAIVGTLPESGDFDSVTMEIKGHIFPPGSEPSPDRYIVSPGYFSVFRIPLISGRTFTDADDRAHQRVVLINQRTAEELFAGQDPIGQQVHIPTPGEFPPGQTPYWTIVGVVGNTQQYGLRSELTMQVYVPYLQYDIEGATLLVRAEHDPLALGGAVRTEVRNVDKSVLMSNFENMEQVLADSIAEQRFSTTLLMTFGIGALLLASLGIYSVISYIVAQRTSEFGIRLALGARPKDVLLLVVRQCMKSVTAGFTVGCLASAAATQLLQRLLFNTSRGDPLTFFAVVMLLGAAALAACYVPARRATQVDPLQALRSE